MGRKMVLRKFHKSVKDAILDMKALGVRQCDITTYYSIPQPTVSNIIRNGRTSTMKKNTEKRGPEEKLLKRGLRALLKHVKANRFKPTHVITSTYNMAASQRLCSKTIRRYLRKYGVSN